MFIYVLLRFKLFYVFKLLFALEFFNCLYNFKIENFYSLIRPTRLAGDPKVWHFATTLASLLLIDKSKYVHFSPLILAHLL